MAAPTPTVRQAPAGRKLDDGFKTLITLSTDPDIEFWEKTVTPPGYDGGEAIDITTMHNVEWRTKASRALKDMTDVSITVAYDPLIFHTTKIQTQINREQTITVTFSDGSTLAFYGFLKNFTPSDSSEGAQPEASVTIVPTNVDPSTGGEAAPVLTNVTGT